jgi:hypothetical protein
MFCFLFALLSVSFFSHIASFALIFSSSSHLLVSKLYMYSFAVLAVIIQEITLIIKAVNLFQFNVNQ